MSIVDMIGNEINEYRKGYEQVRRVTYCSYLPNGIYIEPTNACNLRCIHCVHDGAMTRKLGMINFESYKKVIDDIAPYKVKVFLLQQGEPLLHPQILDMIEYAKRKGLWVGLNTNAALLNEEKARRIIELGTDMVYFSVDGVTKRTYESVRGGAIFEKVIENIIALLKLKKRLRTEKPRTKIVILEQEANKHEVKQFLKKFKMLPFDIVEKEDLLNFTGVVEEANIKLKKFKKESPNYFPLCKMPWETISIDWNGNVCACPLDYDERYVVGNAFEKNIMELWNCNAMKKFREAITHGDYEQIERNGPMCGNCNAPLYLDNRMPISLLEVIKKRIGAYYRALTSWYERNTKTESKYRFLMNYGGDWIEFLAKKEE